MTPIERVQQLYAAFGRGAIPAILDQLASDVDWEYGTLGAPVPWLQPRKGRAAAAGFFQVLADQLEITQFEPKAILGQGNLVVAVIDVQIRVKATGRVVTEPEEIHIWHFNDQGQVQKFRHRVDTWASAQALAA
jgi:uncharacterized protein